MTYQQPPLPPPPDGYANWLDAIVDGTWHARDELAALRKELSDTKRHLDYVESFAKAEGIKHIDRLRELNDTQGLLATAQQNLVAMDAQRAEAVRERDQSQAALAQATTRQCYVDRKKAEQERDEAIKELEEVDEALQEEVRARNAYHDVEAALDRAVQERDALRAQVAEMREAILGLGEIREFQVRLEFNRAQLDCGRADAKKFNALVTKLRAEPAPKEEKQP